MLILVKVAIDAVIDYWDAFTSNDISSIPKELSDAFGEVKSEIERDATLHKFIEGRHRLDLAFKEAASKRTALMLWRMSDGHSTLISFHLRSSRKDWSGLAHNL